jgi:two-component system response regulator DesR
MSLRIMIAEDQTMVRQALVALLELEPDIQVVAEAAGGDEALAMARKHQPDVAVLDIEMPGPGGIEVARLLTASGFPGKIVIVTTFGRPGYLRAAMAAGASGFLLKDAPAAELAEAIRRVAAGARRRFRAGRGRADRGREPAEPARDRRARRGGGARHHRGRRRPAAPVARHRAQPPVGRDPEAGRPQPRRRRADREGEGLAVTRLRPR